LKRILCYGDSNTWGYNPNETDPVSGRCLRYDESTRWPKVMAAGLGAFYEVLEMGLNGRTTVFEDPTEGSRNGFASLEGIFRTCDPVDRVIFMLGTNDAKDMFHASAAVITDGMERIIRKTKELISDSLSVDARILLVCPPPCSGDRTGAYWYDMGPDSNRKGRELKARYKELAKRMGCDFFDAGTVAKPDPRDGVHLDAESHRKLGRAIAEIILTDQEAREKK